MTRTITVDHLTRVEGHGGIKVFLEGDDVRKIEMNVFEGIRMFEGLVRGRSMEDVTGIVSRICAICSHGHSITSLQALENALGVGVSPQTRLLRDLAFQGANIESHALHVFVLALPDFAGHPSVISLAGRAPATVALALRLKKLGNSIQEVVGGRAVHPVNYVIGGFGKAPSIDDLITLKQQLLAGREDCRPALEALQGVKIPRYAEAGIRCAALESEGEAFFFGKTILVSEDGALERIPVAEYRHFTNEQCVRHSHAKRSAYRGKPYMVGALPRLTLNGRHIGGMARQAWDALGLTVPSTNVVMNNVAQFVELVFSVERALAIVEQLVETGVTHESPAGCRPHACVGASATEVPRGTLFYSYELDERGRIAAADVITPTAQNLNHAEEQMRAAVRVGMDAGASDEQLQRRLEIVARAYDPCISCSVHVIRA